MAAAIVLAPVVGRADEGITIGAGGAMASAIGVIGALVGLLSWLLKRQGDTKSDVQSNTQITSDAAKRIVEIAADVKTVLVAQAEAAKQSVAVQKDLEHLTSEVSGLRQRMHSAEQAITKLSLFQEMERRFGKSWGSVRVTDEEPQK